MKKRLFYFLMFLLCFGTGFFIGTQWNNHQPVYVFNDYGTMATAALGFNADTPGEDLPQAAQWVTYVDTNRETLEVVVYIREGSGVPVTREFVESSVKNKDGYTLKAVHTTPFTYGEILEKMQIIKTIFQQYGSDEIWGETPWLICEIHTDEEYGVHIRAAINDPVWGQAGYTESDKDSLVACVNMVCGGAHAGKSDCVVWADDLEPYQGFSPATYAQYPYNEEIM